ncbi:MAG: ABC transporter substrate-binding protein [Reyranella sp.]|nr:ABC transporter substrate-binding protein [Reyranella sp.]
MSSLRHVGMTAIFALSTIGLSVMGAQAQTRQETLRIVSGGAINTLDSTLLNATRDSLGLSVNTYDRLVSFTTKQVNGNRVFDLYKFRGELAESFDVSPDGLKITFKLRPGVTFHDGTPVTVEDVKWSLDRAVLAKSGAASQLASGSLTKPEQFAIVDERTVTVTLEKPDQLALANLATHFARIINRKVALQHATPEDPWANEWLKDNIASSGAYIVESFKPAEQVVLRRNDAWKNGIDGRLPFFKRVLIQTVPEAGTRANLIERGDADISIDLAANDVIALQQRGKVKVISNPQINAFTYIAFNTQKPPFDNLKLRQAIAAALPYKSMLEAAIYGRGAPLFGASWSGLPPTQDFPQALPLKTDWDAAKKLMAESGVAPFKTSISYSTANAGVAEPLSALVKEALAPLGIDVEIRKLPDAQLASVATNKTYDLITETTSAMLPSTDYFFRIFFQGSSRWNLGNWTNQEIVELAAKARFEADKAAYDAMARKMIGLEATDLPVIPLWQANQEAVMARSVSGYTYWYHRQIDFRDLVRE